jgi:hypothetical protein
MYILYHDPALSHVLCCYFIPVWVAYISHITFVTIYLFEPLLFSIVICLCQNGWSQDLEAHTLMIITRFISPFVQQARFICATYTISFHVYYKGLINSFILMELDGDVFIMQA